jgi:3-oxoacyl-[acyl-carrier protein] reductase
MDTRVTSSLRAHVALVTGAGRGIGRAIAVQLARSGCPVAALARTESDLAETAAEAAADPHAATVLPLVADLTRDADLERAVRVIIERLGRITVLINHAGFAPPRTTLLKTSLADWDRTLAICLRAPMVLTRLVLPDMLAHGRGTIVNVAPIAGQRGRAGEASYAAAKFGLLGFTQSLFAEVREHGITVAAIVPGPVSPEPVPPEEHGRALRPADIAAAVLQVLAAPPGACPVEIVLEPLHVPAP